MASSHWPILAANWKMQLSPSQAAAVAAAIVQQSANLTSGVRLVLCPSYISLPEVGRILAGSTVQLGAQDTFWDRRGAFTGEVSPQDLRGLGATYVIVGHSERRQLLGETDAMVSRKMVAALGHELQPILCVGETAAQRADHQHEAVVRQQLQAAFRSLPPPGRGHRMAIAYEPIWAIGTGQPADPAIAEHMRQVIHQVLVDLYDEPVVDRHFSILYGGSVDAKNITRYISPDGYDGALVGTASLKAEEFVTMASAIIDSHA